MSNYPDDLRYNYFDSQEQIAPQAELAEVIEAQKHYREAMRCQMLLMKKSKLQLGFTREHLEDISGGIEAMLTSVVGPSLRSLEDQGFMEDVTGPYPDQFVDGLYAELVNFRPTLRPVATNPATGSIIAVRCGDSVQFIQHEGVA